GTDLESKPPRAGLLGGGEGWPGALGVDPAALAGHGRGPVVGAALQLGLDHPLGHALGRLDDAALDVLGDAPHFELAEGGRGDAHGAPVLEFDIGQAADAVGGPGGGGVVALDAPSVEGGDLVFVLW